MSLVPCIACADAEREIARLTRRAERARANDRPYDALLATIRQRQQVMRSCDHVSMQRANAATRARHAAARGDVA